MLFVGCCVWIRRKAPMKYVKTHFFQKKLASFNLASITLSFPILTKPFLSSEFDTTKKILVKFYEKVHPGGPGWRPIASLAPHVKPDSNLGLSVLGAAVGSGVVYSLLWSIGRMIFQDYQNAAVGMLVAIVCGVTMFGIVRKLTQPE